MCQADVTPHLNERLILRPSPFPDVFQMVPDVSGGFPDVSLYLVLYFMFLILLFGFFSLAVIHSSTAITSRNGNWCRHYRNSFENFSKTKMTK